MSNEMRRIENHRRKCKKAAKRWRMENVFSKRRFFMFTNVRAQRIGQCGFIYARAVLLLLLCLSRASSESVIVRLQEGAISGFISHSNSSAVRHVPLATFLGVPYGESTAGDARWSPPRPKIPWSETRDATTFAAACPGGSMSGNLSDARVYSEDCLFANVWTPASALNTLGQLLPVVVWIHGGGFFSGTASDPVMWGHQWAARGVVFVSFDYRLGALGFFHSSSESSAVNFGLLDQLLLLDWVKRNAQSFGGNSSNVTLLGQSAGAMSILLLSTMPASLGPEPLFSQAIICSPVGLHYKTIQEALPGMESFAQSLGCSERDLKCLRHKSFHDILAVQFLEYVHFLEDGFDNFLPWMPLIAPQLQGGLPSNPLDSFRSGKFHRVPFIIGSVMNETDAWIPKVLNSSIEVDLVVRTFFGSNASSILEQYRDYDESPPYVRFGILLTDSLVTCYVRQVARLISDVNPGSVRLYTNMHPPSSRADPTNWNHYECTHGSMCHAGDNVFTFASYDGIDGVSFSEFEQNLSDLMVETLVSFTMGSIHSFWPPYTSREDKALQWGCNGQTSCNITGFHEKHCDFWDTHGYQE